MTNQKVVEKLRSIGAQPRKLLKNQISDLVMPITAYIKLT